MSGGFFDRLPGYFHGRLGGWLLEGGFSWMRFLPPDLARRAAMVAFDLANRGALAGAAGAGIVAEDAADAFWASGLRVSLPGFGDLPHPVGLAAGWCMDGRNLPAIEAMGFSFAEIGSLHADGQPRQDLRIKRDPSARTVQLRARASGGAASVVRKGGAFSFEDVAGRTGEASRSGNATFAININVDWEQGAARTVANLLGALGRMSRLAPMPRTQPVVLSFASGMPVREAIRILEAIASGGAIVQHPCLWVKLGPGWGRGDFQNFIETMVELGYQGLVAGSWRNVTWPEPAMLSGAPAFSSSNQLLEWAWAVHKGALPMIGTGGVISGDDAFQKIMRGASAVELLSALWLRGPFAARLVCAELHAEVRRYGLRSVAECIGVFYEEF